jgi:hypothetical protein
LRHDLGITSVGCLGNLDHEPPAPFHFRKPSEHCKPSDLRIQRTGTATATIKEIPIPVCLKLHKFEEV